MVFFLVRGGDERITCINKVSSGLGSVLFLLRCYSLVFASHGAGFGKREVGWMMVGCPCARKAPVLYSNFVRRSSEHEYFGKLTKIFTGRRVKCAFITLAIICIQ